jgi:hypothetical protein
MSSPGRRWAVVGVSGRSWKATFSLNTRKIDQVELAALDDVLSRSNPMKNFLARWRSCSRVPGPSLSRKGAQQAERVTRDALHEATAVELELLCARPERLDAESVSSPSGSANGSPTFCAG